MKAWIRLESNVKVLSIAAAQPAHAADRFAREIIGILTVFAMRLRRLMGIPLGALINACAASDSLSRYNGSRA